MTQIITTLMIFSMAALCVEGKNMQKQEAVSQVTQHRQVNIMSQLTGNERVMLVKLADHMGRMK